jgi:hypothetical protein
MYRILAATLSGVSQCSSYLGSLRCTLLLLAPLTPHAAGAATIVYNPVATQTVQWEYTGTWNWAVKEGLFIQGHRENTVAESFFLLPEFDWAEIDSVTFQITIPAVYSGRSISFTKIYAAAGDPIGLYPAQPLPGRSLLYRFDPRTTTATVMNFDITGALRNSDVLGAKNGQYRFDFTTYVDYSDAPIPIKSAALIVKTVPEPSSALLTLAGLGLLALGRGRRS